MRRAGFTLTEITMVVALLGIMALGLLDSSRSIARLTVTGSTIALLQEQGDRAQRSMMDELRRSGIWELEGRRYPYIFEGSEPTPAFSEHAYTPGGQEAEARDSDFGAAHCVVFVLPALQAYFCCRDAGMRRGPSIVGEVARHTSRAAPSP